MNFAKMTKRETEKKAIHTGKSVRDAEDENAVKVHIDIAGSCEDKRKKFKEIHAATKKMGSSKNKSQFNNKKNSPINRISKVFTRIMKLIKR